LVTIAGQVLEEHAAIEGLLDHLGRATSEVRLGADEGVEQLHKAIWNLYLAFLDHLLYEERRLAPLLSEVAGEDSARKMILEHNEERGVLLKLVEDSESDALEAEALATQADDLIARFRTDMLHEERVLSALVPNLAREYKAQGLRSG
jgi:hypothetical protein